MGWIFLDAQTYNAQTNVARLTLPRDSGHSKPNYGLLTHWLLTPNPLFGQLKPKGLMDTWCLTHFWTPDAQEFDRHLTPGLMTSRHLTPNFIMDTWRPDMWRPNTFWTPDARTYDAWALFGHLTPGHATTPEQFLDTWCLDMWPPNSSYSTQILEYNVGTPDANPLPFAYTTTLQYCWKCDPFCLIYEITYWKVQK